MPKKIPYLARRGNVFHLRIAIPSELRDTFQEREFIQSLDTECRRDAEPKALALAARVKRLFNDTKPMDLKTKRRLHVKDELRKLSEVRHQDEMERKEWEHLAELRRVAADATLKAENDLLTHLVMVGSLSTNPTSVDAEVSAPAKSNVPTLSAVIEEFLAHYDPNKRAMLKKHKANLPVFLELLGDKPVNQIRHTDLNRAAIDLCKVPNERGKPEFKGMTFRQMIESANDVDRLHAVTFANYKSSLKQFIEWARGLYDGAFDNVNVAEIKYTGTRKDNEGSQRSFKPEELIKLFTCADMKKYCANGKQVHKFWLPVIGLFTGCRVNEICQINPTLDVKQDESGVWFIQITEGTETAEDVIKSVKTDAGERIVPIHSKLIELGFLQYIAELKNAGHKVLFPQWKAKNGKAGDNAARDFRRFLENVGLRDDAVGKKLVGMHAFRKTVITSAYKGGFINNMISIIGHESDVKDETGKSLPDVTLKYIDDEVLEVPLSEKQATIEKLKFDVPFYKPVKVVLAKPK